MVRNVMGWMVAGMVCLGATAIASAAVYDFNGKLVDIEYWAGSGDNEALMVLDFGEGESFVFGYRWNDGDLFTRPEFEDVDPTVSAGTGEAMLMTLAQEGGFDLGFTYFPGLGLSVTSLSYNGHSFVSDWINNFASLWHSGNVEYTDWNGDFYPAMEPDGTTWISAGLGASDLVLLDGFYHGWTRGIVVDDQYLADPPVIHFVPEPTSLAALALGGLAMLRRNRR